MDFDTSALASVLMSALSGNLGNDLWEAACRTPQMFERGGYYYNLVANLGPLVDDQHFPLPQLPNKVSLLILLDLHGSTSSPGTSRAGEREEEGPGDEVVHLPIPYRERLGRSHR